MSFATEDVLTDGGAPQVTAWLRWGGQAVLASGALALTGFDRGFIPLVGAMLGCGITYAYCLYGLFSGQNGRLCPFIRIVAFTALCSGAVQVGKWLYSVEMTARLTQYQILADRLTGELEKNGGDHVSEHRPIWRIQYAIADRNRHSGKICVTLVVGSYFGDALAIRGGIKYFGGGPPPAEDSWRYPPPLGGGWYAY